MADALIRNWSDLPSDLLIKILGRLNARIYHLLLRAVCPAWRSALPLSSGGCPLHRYQSWSQSNSQSNIEEIVLFLISSPNNRLRKWVVHVRETEANTWSFFNPITGGEFDFPSSAKTEPINLLDYRITELGRSSVLRQGGSIIRKLICLPSLASISNYSCVFAGLTNNALLCLFESAEFKTWDQFYPKDAFVKDHVSCFSSRCAFMDIISFKGRLYAVDELCRLVMFDPLSWREHVPVVTCPLDVDDEDRGIKCLVESEGSLYLVVGGNVVLGDSQCSYGNFGTKVQVFVLKEEKGRDAKWAQVRSIGDRVFFVGLHVSFSVSSSTSVLNKANCIYLRGVTYWEFNARFRVDAGIYDLNEDKFMQFNHLAHDRNDQAHARLCWPPPSWICNWDLDMGPFNYDWETGFEYDSDDSYDIGPNDDSEVFDTDPNDDSDGYVDMIRRSNGSFFS